MFYFNHFYTINNTRYFDLQTWTAISIRELVVEYGSINLE